MARFEDVHDSHDHTGVPGVAGGGGPVELAYVEFTTTVTVSAESEGAANAVVTDSSRAFDGDTTVMIEFQCTYAQAQEGNGYDLFIVLFDGSSVVGRLAYVDNTGGGSDLRVPVHAARRLTPSNGNHTYNVKAYKAGTGDAAIGAGAGGETTNLPGFLRITTVVTA